MKPGFPSR